MNEALNGKGRVFAALSWAANGNLVYPVDERTRKPLTANGPKDASREPDVINAWWKEHPGAGIGYIPKKPAVAATSFIWIDPASIPRRQFVYGHHYIRQFVSTTVAPGGVGKSSLGIVEALALASGKPLLGILPAARGRVWLFNGEDPMEELQRRIMAAAQHYKLTPEDIEDRLFVDSGRVTPIIIATQTRDGAKVAAPIVRAVTQTIENNRIDATIIDPFVSSHRVTENDNNAIEQVAKTWAGIADETHCAIDLVHHSRKTGGAEVTVEDSRGASALLSAARAGRVLNVMSADEAEKAGVENRRLYFRVDNGKANLTPPLDKAEWYRLESVPLGNGVSAEHPTSKLDFNKAGDNVGVVAAWQWPNPLDNITTADLRAAQKAVADGGPWRENSQANDWVGKPIAAVLKLDTANKAHVRKISGLLKVWIENGMFARVTGKDAKRMEKTFIEVGQWATD